MCEHIQSLTIFRGQSGFDRDNTNDPSMEKKANDSPMFYNLQGHSSYNGVNTSYDYAKQCYFLAFVPFLSNCTSLSLPRIRNGPLLSHIPLNDHSVSYTKT